MDLLLAWILFPLVAGAVCLALGLLVERLSGAVLPGALLLPVGMAGLVASTQLTTYLDVTAELTLPLVLVLVAAGAVLGRERLRALRPDGWLALGLAGVAAVFAAPVVLSGDATFAGYTVLGDTANHMLGADALLEYGRQFDPLPPSTYEYALFGYFDRGAYPSGGPTAIGVLTRLVFQDVAWTFQPFLTVLVVLMGMALWSLATPWVESRKLRAAIVFLACQPALVLAYALQGSVKEIGTAYAVTTVAACVPAYVRGAGESIRRALPLAVTAAAAVAIVGIAAIVWIGPLCVVALGAALWGRLRDLPVVLGGVGLFLAVAALLNWQSLLMLGDYVVVAGGTVTSEEFGNLLRPLDPLQKFGVWLIGDYRLEPAGSDFTYTKIFIGFVVGAVALSAIWAARARPRPWMPVAFLAVSLVAYLYVVGRGSPWADGKALMIFSTPLMLAAGLGAAYVGRTVRPWAAWGLLAVIGLGVLWSNALAYHDASIAPRDRFEELQTVGDEIAGEGPTLTLEFEEFAKHFLRDAAPEGPSEGYQRRYAFANDRTGIRPAFGFTMEADRFTEEYVTYYRTIVQRRGFAYSRPPAMYERVWSGEFYEVWQRPERPPHRLIAHLPIGQLRVPSGVPADCAEIERLAGQARSEGGRLAYVERTSSVLLGVAGIEPRPPGWGVDPADSSVLLVHGAGKLEGPVEVPRAGRFDVWLEVSDPRGYEVLVDGRRVGRAGAINGRAVSEKVGTVELEAGSHTIVLLRPGGTLAPGNGGMRRLGPVGLVPAGAEEHPVSEIEPERWEELCGKELDWVEAVA
jgi:hypothetical protein